MTEILKITRPGPALSFQGICQLGLAKFGIPPGGPMDPESASLARRLIGQSPRTILLEIGLGGTLIEAVTDLWMAHIGGLDCSSLPSNTARMITAGTKLEFAPGKGMWSYLAIDGEYELPHQLGTYSQAITGTDLSSIHAKINPSAHSSIASRFLSGDQAKKWEPDPILTIHRGPHTENFDCSDLEHFTRNNWTVSELSNRSGYRLNGAKLGSPLEIKSIPVFPGCIQIPPSGQPIVVLNDGPTVGGYPILGVVDSLDLPKLTQRRPQQSLHFNWYE